MKNKGWSCEIIFKLNQTLKHACRTSLQFFFIKILRIYMRKEKEEIMEDLSHLPMNDRVRVRSRESRIYEYAKGHSTYLF